MTEIDMKSIVRSVPEDKVIYDRIIQTYIEPLYVNKELRADIYNRIKDEADFLRKRKRKVKKEASGTELPKNVGNPKHLKQNPPVAPMRQLPNVSVPPRTPGTPKGGSSNQKNLPLEAAFTEKISKLKDKNRALEDKIDSLTDEIENMRDEANSLRTRLSKMAGDKLKTNNPNIVDLSDKYRPTELGKQFSELYDNEWSDAFEEVHQVLKDEMKCVLVLYNTVKDTFQSCKEKAKVQEERIRDILLDLEDQNGRKVGIATRIENLHNQLIEPRKSILDVSSVNVAKNYLHGEFSQTIRSYKIKQPGQKLTRFAQKCAELCWCMTMCDPPMAMNSGDINKPFDKNTYKEYTRSTKDLRVPVVEFIVWPALYLNSGGSMVSKGVAQPYEKQNKDIKYK